MAISPSPALQRREAPSEGHSRPRSRLRLVSRLSRPSRRPPAHRLAFVASALVVGVCLLVVSAQAVVASRQIRIDNLRQQLANSVATNENLAVQRAALSSPTRILQIAEHKLGMIPPKSVTYLVPINPLSVHFTPTVTAAKAITK
jgi:cell division protein FtsL